MIKQIKFVSIPVADQDRALDFYTEKLGSPSLRISRSTRSSAGSNCTFQKRRLMNVPTRPLSYTCDDLQKTYGELKKRGVEFENPPQKQSWGNYAIFKDSEGNRFVLGD